jgi:hypothetical protein
MASQTTTTEVSHVLSRSADNGNEKNRYHCFIPWCTPRQWGPAKNEHLRQKRWFQFSYWQQSIYILQHSSSTCTLEYIYIYSSSYVLSFILLSNTCPMMTWATHRMPLVVQQSSCPPHHLTSSFSVILPILSLLCGMLSTTIFYHRSVCSFDRHV